MPPPRRSAEEAEDDEDDKDDGADPLVLMWAAEQRAKREGHGPGQLQRAVSKII